MTPAQSMQTHLDEILERPELLAAIEKIAGKYADPGAALPEIRSLVLENAALMQNRALTRNVLQLVELDPAAVNTYIDVRAGLKLMNIKPELLTELDTAIENNGHAEMMLGIMIPGSPTPPAEIPAAQISNTPTLHEIKALMLSRGNVEGNSKFEKIWDAEVNALLSRGAKSSAHAAPPSNVESNILVERLGLSCELDGFIRRYPELVSAYIEARRSLRDAYMTSSELGELNRISTKNPLWKAGSSAEALTL